MNHAEMEGKPVARRAEKITWNMSQSDPNKLESFTIEYSYGKLKFAGNTTVNENSTKPSGKIISNFKRL